MYPQEVVLEREMLVDALPDVSLTLLLQLKKAGGRAFDAVGLTYGQAMLLVLIQRGHTQPGHLSEILGMVRPAISTLITYFVDLGLLKRGYDGSDARRIVVSLTPAGHKACFSLKRAFREQSTFDLNSFSDEELKILIAAARIAIKRGLI